MYFDQCVSFILVYVCTTSCSRCLWVCRLLHLM